MENNKYTKKCKTRYILYSLLSWILCFGICAYFIISAINGRTPDVNLKEKYGTLLYSLVVSLGIAVILSLIVKDKVEPTVWMINIILAGYLYSMTGIYVVFGIWFVDNYGFKLLKNNYKAKYLINKEIDKRE